MTRSLSPFVDRLPGPVIAFGIGLGLPLALRLFGSSAPDLYDAWIIPFLHRVLLPALPIAVLATGVIGIWRSESLRTGAPAMCAIGAALGFPLVYDWWYFTPLSLSLLATVAVWQVQLSLWARSKWAAALCGTVMILVLGISYGQMRGAPGFDPRFGIGFSSDIEPWVRCGLLIALAFALARWVFGISTRSEARYRSVLAACIDEEPRASSYLRASAFLTRCTFTTPDWLRPFRQSLLPSSASSVNGNLTSFPDTARAPLLAKVIRQIIQAFVPQTPPPVVPQPGMKLDPLAPTPPPLSRWFGLPLLGSFLRRWRAPADGPGHPSPIIREMLEEAATFEWQAALDALHGHWRAQADGSDQPSPITRKTREKAATPCSQIAPDALRGKEGLGVWDQFIEISDLDWIVRGAASNRRFARCVQLREALIVARHTLFLGSMPLSARAWRSFAGVLLPRFENGLLNPALYACPPLAPEPAAKSFSAASFEMLGIWADNIDRLFLHHGERLFEVEGSTTMPIDFAGLTCNLLSLRRASRIRKAAAPGDETNLALGGAASLHDLAADFALWLLIGALSPDSKQTPADAEEESRVWQPEAFELLCGGAHALERYFKTLAHFGAQREWGALALTAAAYAMLRAAMGSWELAALPYSLFQPLVGRLDADAKSVDPVCALLCRVAGITKACDALAAFSQAMQIGQPPMTLGSICETSLSLFQIVDLSPSLPLPGRRQIIARPSLDALRQTLGSDR